MSTRKNLYNLTELAQLGLVGYKTPKTIKGLIERGELKYSHRNKTKNGYRYLISTSNIKEYLGE